MRSIVVDASSGTVFTAGEDGHIRAWHLNGGDDNGENNMEEGTGSKKKKSITDQRYKPY